MIEKILNALNSQSPSVQELDDIRFTTVTATIDVKACTLAVQTLPPLVPHDDPELHVNVKGPLIKNQLSSEATMPINLSNILVTAIGGCLSYEH
ncbi:hypothetical protein P5673_016037 [Acropora cervicornis]|uniref:Uncharacterized protein n=1 Tax=Acropora cervicornis TaxID=6130 RepID=A0AAD9QGR1_ACRCE|nr:hypothetical protein P5673_016037 [Acropora cervicornis]